MIERYEANIYTVKEYLPVIFLFLFLIGLGTYQVIKVGNPSEIKLSTKLDEIVISVFSLKSSIYVKVENREERITIDYSRNYDYEPMELSEFIEPGDRIVKNECSDTLFIMRQGEKFYFLIEDVLLNSTHRSQEFIQKWRKNRTLINERNDCK